MAFRILELSFRAERILRENGHDTDHAALEAVRTGALTLERLVSFTQCGIHTAAEIMAECQPDYLRLRSRDNSAARALSARRVEEYVAALRAAKHR